MKKLTTILLGATLCFAVVVFAFYCSPFNEVVDLDVESLHPLNRVLYNFHYEWGEGSLGRVKIWYTTPSLLANILLLCGLSGGAVLLYKSTKQQEHNQPKTHNPFLRLPKLAHLPFIFFVCLLIAGLPILLFNPPYTSFAGLTARLHPMWTVFVALLLFFGCWGLMLMYESGTEKVQRPKRVLLVGVLVYVMVAFILEVVFRMSLLQILQSQV